MEKDIGKIPKNDTTDIVVRVDDFGGKRGLTVREFVTSDRYTGFTKAGVRIPAGEFAKFKEMINSISEDEMKEEPEPAESEAANAPGQETLDKSSDAKAEDKSKSSESSEKGKENLPDY
ncbi:hypothetical protein GF378_03060 [Candidatus Pacearchaeota archaeon]|nr:hypothetical protein [Candidatus Pacearchaeota archaeon]